MSDTLLQAAQDLMSSPWIYVAVLVIALVDGFLPLVPSESLVITAGVFAAQGEPNLLALVAVAAAGAFVGDHTSYLLGRLSGSRRVDRLRPGTRRYLVLTKAQDALTERGGLVLVVARYVPGGRTAVTLSMGALRYRLASFTGYAAVAAVSWAVYSALVGFLGGHAFEQDPIRGVLLGIGFALTVTAVVELVRHRRGRRPVRPRAPQPQPAPCSAHPAG